MDGSESKRIKEKYSPNVDFLKHWLDASPNYAYLLQYPKKEGLGRLLNPSIPIFSLMKIFAVLQKENPERERENKKIYVRILSCKNRAQLLPPRPLTNFVDDHHILYIKNTWGLGIMFGL